MDKERLINIVKRLTFNEMRVYDFDVNDEGVVVYLQNVDKDIEDKVVITRKELIYLANEGKLKYNVLKQIIIDRV